MDQLSVHALIQQKKLSKKIVVHQKGLLQVNEIMNKKIFFYYNYLINK